MAKTSPKDVLTTQETALDIAGLEALLAQLDADTVREQAEYDHLMALVAPVKASHKDRGLRLMALEREQERRAAEATANAAADKARTRLERDTAAMLANPSQIGKGLAGVLQTIVQSDWWGKHLGTIVDAREDDDDKKVVVYSGKLYATVSILPDGYDIDISTSDQILKELIRQVYAASEQQLRNPSTNHIGFRVKPDAGARVMAMVDDGSGWGHMFKAFDTNPQLVAQVASAVIDLLNNGTIKIGNSEVPRQPAGGDNSGYSF